MIFLFAIANSLRGKTGGTENIVADDFPSVIDSLSTGGITPTGTKTIAENGTHDVTNYASASVNVPVGITPSGSITITENGTYDVTEKSSAVVEVPATPQNMVVLPITLSSNVGGSAAENKVLVSGNDFVKAHYADEGFFGMLIHLNTSSVVHTSGVVPFVYQGNRSIANCKSPVYGFRVNGAGSASNAGAAIHTSKVSTNGYVVALRAKNTGEVSVYVQANSTVIAGNYLLILAVA